MSCRRVAFLKTAQDLRGHLVSQQIDLDFDELVQSGSDSPLAKAYSLPGGGTVGNRFCALPMEGWDGTRDGRPTELTFRRWRRFGESGAKLVWGGEAAAVVPEGRSNPNQLLVNAHTLPDLEKLRQTLVQAHAAQHGEAGLLVGLQLTHSGRYSRPNDHHTEPRILYHHPILNPRLGLPKDYPLVSDAEIEQIIAAFGQAARLAQEAGFDFVDLKHCHGYLGHEFLSAVDRPGRFGGDFENRTRFLRETVEEIHLAAPGLAIGVRLSAFDFIPFRPGPSGTGQPEPYDGHYPYAFGGDGSGLGIDLEEPQRLLRLLEELGIRMVCVTAGSPYYNPHIQRPALFPPSDGYLPPEDPLAGVARQIKAAAALKKHHPEMLVVGSALSYLQEWLPNVAQNAVRCGLVDFAGLGRMLLSYPELPGDVLAGRPLQRGRLCRTFSDCTTAPRLGLVSGCYPLDDFYKERAESRILKDFKTGRALQPS